MTAQSSDQPEQAATVGVAIIAYNSRRHLQSCLTPLLQSSPQPRIVVVDPQSTDDTVQEATRLGAEVLSISYENFNHGSTRELARKYLATDIVVMMTPDAYAIDADMLTKLVEPIRTGQAAIAYARQIPRDGESFYGRFLRQFNYPAQSHTRSMSDVAEHGILTTFCSDSCCAYSNAALDAAGGVPSVLCHEDQIVGAMLVSRGHRIAYVADAVVKHSHTYSLMQEFRRSFDNAMAREAAKEVLAPFGKMSSRGRTYVGKLLKAVARHRPWSLPYAIMHIGAKWIGFKMGVNLMGASVRLKRWCSASPFYWTSRDFRERRGFVPDRS